MMRQPSLVFVILILSLLGTNACADGMPLRHSALRPCGTGPFAGAYIGAAVGYGRERAEITDERNGSKFRDNDGTVTFGGYTGYNWQCDGLVFGAETDFNYLNTSTTAFDNTSAPAEIRSFESRMDWFGTLRARAGFLAHEDFLLYATGGLAYAEVNRTFDNTNVNGLLGPFLQSSNDTKAGWTLGGGAEYLHDSRWLLRAEAVYVDLGDDIAVYNFVRTPTCSGTCQAAALRWEDDRFWVTRLGLTYMLGVP